MEKQINYDGRIFKGVENLSTSDVDDRTTFFYHQKDDYLWGHYEGGAITIGVIIGQVSYWHYDLRGDLKGGICHSTPQWKDGILHLNESWSWTQGKKGSGTSIIREIKKK